MLVIFYKSSSSQIDYFLKQSVVLQQVFLLVYILPVVKRVYLATNLQCCFYWRGMPTAGSGNVSLEGMCLSKGKNEPCCRRVEKMILEVKRDKTLVTVMTVLPRSCNKPSLFKAMTVFSFSLPVALMLLFSFLFSVWSNCGQSVIFLSVFLRLGKSMNVN